MDSTLYDQDDYYKSDSRASRLAPFLNPLLSVLDRFRVSHDLKVTGLTRGHVLDVGAGDGKYLFYMRRAGLVPFGTTLSQKSKQAAADCYQIDLVYGGEIPPEYKSALFQLISYHHVFEHLTSPKSHIEQWSKMAGPESWLVIEVPNIDSIGAQIGYHSWLGSDDRHHINHQPPADIIRQIEEQGFRVIRKETFSLKFSYVYLWSALLGCIFRKAYDFDKTFDMIRSPRKALIRYPIRALNGYLSLIYLMPIIIAILGLAPSRRGEVFRVYGRYDGA